MTNVLNSLNEQNNNVIGAKKLTGTSKSSVGVIEAPQQIYKYSLTKELQKKDEFRKNIAAEKTLKTVKKSPWGKICAIISVLGGLAVLKKLKNIKVK